MKRQIKPKLICQDSDDSSNSEDTDVIAQNLENEVKRRKLIAYPRIIFDKCLEEDNNSRSYKERSNNGNLLFMDEPSTSTHYQNSHQVQLVNISETVQVAENSENDLLETVNELTTDEILTQERNDDSSEVTLPEEMPNPLSNEESMSNDLQVNSFMRMKLNVQTFNGHSDMIQVILRDENVILSASFDTTVKVWNAEGEEICSLRGHTGPVKGITVFSIENSKHLARKLHCNQVERIAISGSQDCSLKLWILPNGKQIKSIYVFNGITCLSPLKDFTVLIGTESGKIQMWNILEETNLFSIQAYIDEVLSLQFNNQRVFSLSQSGIFKVWNCADWQLEDNTQLIENEDQKENWACFSLHNDKLYLANNDWDVYILHLTTNKLEILKKCFHSKGYFCDNYQVNTMCIAEDKLLFSKYNHKFNTGCIDVYSLPDCDYSCSLIGEISFVKCISFSQLSENNCSLMTGGKELIIWNLSSRISQSDGQCNNDDSRFSVVHKVTNIEEENDSSSFQILKNYFKNTNSTFYINKLCHIL